MVLRYGGDLKRRPRERPGKAAGPTRRYQFPLSPSSLFPSLRTQWKEGRFDIEEWADLRDKRKSEGSNTRWIRDRARRRRREERKRDFVLADVVAHEAVAEVGELVTLKRFREEVGDVEVSADVKYTK